MTDKELKDWCTGFALAAFLTPHPFPQREPIGYLYGHVAKEGEEYTHEINGKKYVGVVASDIYTVYTPEVEAKYPYVCVGAIGESAILMAYSSYVLEATKDGETGVKTYEPWLLSGLATALTEWKHFGEMTTPETLFCIGDKVWVNKNVIDSDGKLLVAETERVPIYA